MDRWNVEASREWFFEMILFWIQKWNFIFGYPKENVKEQKYERWNVILYKNLDNFTRNKRMKSVYGSIERIRRFSFESRNESSSPIIWTYKAVQK